MIIGLKISMHKNKSDLQFIRKKSLDLSLKYIYSSVFYSNNCHPADGKCYRQKQLAYANITTRFKMAQNLSQMNDSISNHVDPRRLDYSSARNCKGIKRETEFFKFK